MATPLPRPEARRDGERLPRVDDKPMPPSPRPLFDELYDRWFDHVTRWVRALGASEGEREDITQEVFIVAHRRLADFDGRNAAAWLYQIARRKVRDHRRLASINHIFRSFLPLREASLTTSRGPLDALETREKAELLAQLLDTLSVEQRAAFVLFELEGHSGDEISRAQGVPINTVWARIFEARKSLRKRLGQWERTETRAVRK